MSHLHGIKGEQGEGEALAGGVVLGVQRAPPLSQVQLQLRLGRRGGDEEADPVGEWGSGMPRGDLRCASSWGIGLAL